MEKLWFYTKSGSTEKQGPISEAELKQHIGSGEITIHDLVWSEGMSNWMSLAHIPELKSALPAQGTTAGVPVPEGLVGWTGFVGVMNIVGGIFSCISCFGIITGIFMIIGGAALMAAKNALAGVASVDASLGTFFQKLKTFMQMMGIMYIISLIGLVIIFVFYFSMFAAVLAAAGGAAPQ